MALCGLIFASQQQHIGFLALSLIAATLFTAEHKEERILHKQGMS
jgi:hypothetical protein